MFNISLVILIFMEKNFVNKIMSPQTETKTGAGFKAGVNFESFFYISIIFQNLILHLVFLYYLID
jgi:hypothetical protein